MFKTGEEIEADRIALEIGRAQVPGSSGGAFAPVGNLVAIGTRDTIWVAATATGDEQGVLVRNVQTGQTVGELPTRGFGEHLELFGENKLLVSGSGVALWTFLQEEEELALENPGLEAQVAGQFTAQAAETVVMGSLIAVGVVACAFGACDGASLWNLGSASYSAATTPIDSSRQPWCGRSTAVSPDGKWLVDVYPGVTNEVVRIFDVRSGALVKTLNPGGEYHCIAKFSPDSRQLLITSSKAAILYSTDTWRHHDIRLGGVPPRTRDLRSVAAASVRLSEGGAGRPNAAQRRFSG